MKKRKEKYEGKESGEKPFFTLYFLPIVKKVKTQSTFLSPLLSNLITGNLRGGIFSQTVAISCDNG